MISLSIKSLICILKATLTNGLSINSGIFSNESPYNSTRLAIGGLISILRLNIEDIDVAAEPIIWFIASPIALK